MMASATRLNMAELLAYAKKIGNPNYTTKVMVYSLQ